MNISIEIIFKIMWEQHYEAENLLYLAERTGWGGDWNVVFEDIGVSSTNSFECKQEKSRMFA